MKTHSSHLLSSTAPRANCLPRLALVAAIVGLLSLPAAATVLWETDFTAGNQLSDFLGTGPGLFNSSGATGNGTPTLAFDDAGDVIQLRTYNYTGSASPYPYAGIACTDFGQGNLTIARYELVITPMQENGAVGKRGLLQVGNPSSWNTASSTFGKLDIYFNAGGLVLQNSGNAAEYTTSLGYGAEHRIEILCVNSSATAQTYNDPSGGQRTVQPGTMHIFIDGAYNCTITAMSGRAGNYMKGLQLNIGGHQLGATYSMRGIDVHSLKFDSSLDPLPTNQGPAVAAGIDRTGVPGAPVELDATVTDDGLPDPPGAVTLLWTRQSGPGTVSFDDDSAEDPAATFSQAGTYVLRLTADDGMIEAYDELTVVVYGETIVSPASASGATDGPYFMLEYAFDSQPTWDSVNLCPLGGAVAGYDCPGNPDRWGSIDFGPDWANVRITETWTKYRTGTNGNMTPFDLAWWDADDDKYHDEGPLELMLNFNTAQGLATGTTTPWIRDVHAAMPIRPQRQYLIIHNPNPTTSGRGKEYAFVGYVYNGPNVAPTVDAGISQSVLITDAASLDGEVSDDGYPRAVATSWTKVSGPGTVTFANASAVDTTATFSATGAYVLRLTANDGETESYEEVYVSAYEAAPTLSLAEPQAFNFSQLTLVDEVICGSPSDPHTLYESTNGISSVQTILGSPCRILPDETAEPSYFGYVLGAGGGLQAGRAYVLVVEYPEDASRSMVVLNSGCETNRGFHTGRTVGDCLTTSFGGNTHPESLNYGLTGDFRQWQQLFYLHDRFPGIVRPRSDELRPYLPADGFHVVIAQYASEEDPYSRGAAVKRIALYEAPSYESYIQPLPELPAGLEKRRLFWREEMSDGVIGTTIAENRGVATDTAWYEYKARLHKFLGMNTFAKDLLEFGRCQGWDTSSYADATGSWFVRSSWPHRWEQILVMLAQGGYGLDILPYYEYAGGTGTGQAALGMEKRAIPLARTDGQYTDISWSEDFNIDVSDPDSLTDAIRVLDETITILQDGNRPIPIAVTGKGNATWKPNLWGYIDFGSNWQNARICQTWTRSRNGHGGNASPFSMAYWHSSTSGFSGDTVPQGAIAEDTINFITQVQVNAENRWSKDVDVTSSPITPAARYLVMRSATTLTDCLEFLIVGYINGQGTELQRIAVTAGSASGYPMQDMFDSQTEFNTLGVGVVGAWFRPRVSAIPMGFGDATLARYSADRSISPAVTRSQLQTDATLKADYDLWWLDQRKAFLLALRDHMRTYSDEDAVILYTWDHTEPGAAHASIQPDVTTDTVAIWSWLVPGPMSLDDAISSNLHYLAMTTPIYNYGTWEWPHSVPRGDPANYQDTEGAMMEYVFSKQYTVGSGGAFDEYRTQSGLACIRHYALNENMMRDSSQTDILGYFVSDMELAGPYCMLSEAKAVAYGDPYYFGYLTSNSFSRGFPGYARDFNANFLALPALPLVTHSGAASTSDVVVRSIQTPSDGAWLAIINVSILDQEDVVVTLPVSGTVTDAVTGASVPVNNGTVTLDLWPGQLKTLRIE